MEILIIFGILFAVLFTGLPVFLPLGSLGAGILLFSGQNLALSCRNAVQLHE